MKQGNQFYLEIQLTDKNDNILDIETVSKIQFNFDKIEEPKVYDRENGTVSYDKENQCFKIWLTEKETFSFENEINIDCRVLFLNDTIAGSYTLSEYVYDSVKKVELDDNAENN